jgi:neutral amino acid transport system ATP-binding protein
VGLLSLIGPNGAGKTTLVNILTGFLRPDRGRFSIGGKDATFLSPYKIARKGVRRTFQDVRLAFQSTVIENLMLACSEEGGESLAGASLGFERKDSTRKEVCRSVLTSAGLEAKAQDFAGNLSYGQQKYLSLLCCIVGGAKIIFLDEPLAGVDPGMSDIMQATLLELRAQGHLVIFIEHNMEVVKKLAEGMIVMSGGAVVAQGTPTDLLARDDIMEFYLS